MNSHYIIEVLYLQMVVENIHRNDEVNVKGTFVVRANFWPVAKDIAAMKRDWNGLLLLTPY